MGTRRKARKLYRRALSAYRDGVYWEGGYQVAAPDGSDPCRVAFDAGRATAQDGHPGRAMPLEVWTQVLATWLAV